MDVGNAFTAFQSGMDAALSASCRVAGLLSRLLWLRSLAPFHADEELIASVSADVPGRQVGKLLDEKAIFGLNGQNGFVRCFPKKSANESQELLGLLGQIGKGWAQKNVHGFLTRNPAFGPAVSISAQDLDAVRNAKFSDVFVNIGDLAGIFF